MVNKPLIRPYFWGWFVAWRGVGWLSITHIHKKTSTQHTSTLQSKSSFFHHVSSFFPMFPHVSTIFFQISSSPRHLKNKVHKFLCFWNASLLNICCIPRLWDLVLRFFVGWSWKLNPCEFGGWAPRTDVSSWTTLRRWPWCFKVFLLLSAITSGHLRSVGWGGVGMMTFLELAHMVGATQHHVALAHMVGATQHHVSCTCTHGRCYATSCFLHLHTWSVLRNIMFLALAHMVGATQHHVSCTCTHGRCYATSCFLHLHTWSALRNIMFLALAHMVGATQHHVSCTCTHGRCYATSCFLDLHTWSVLRNIMFLALAHMVGATQHHVSCTCTHGRCYATSWCCATAVRKSFCRPI